jgi:excisionase family DNA binding protein
MTAEHTKSTETWVPFLIDLADLCRILHVSKPFISRMLDAGTFPIPAVRLGNRVVRFKRPDVEAYFGAPLSDLAPWLQAPKETA